MKSGTVLCTLHFALHPLCCARPLRARALAARCLQMSPCVSKQVFWKLEGHLRGELLSCLSISSNRKLFLPNGSPLPQLPLLALCNCAPLLWPAASPQSKQRMISEPAAQQCVICHNRLRLHPACFIRPQMDHFMAAFAQFAPGFLLLESAPRWPLAHPPAHPPTCRNPATCPPMPHPCPPVALTCPPASPRLSLCHTHSRLTPQPPPAPHHPPSGYEITDAADLADGRCVVRADIVERGRRAEEATSWAFVMKMQARSEGARGAVGGAGACQPGGCCTHGFLLGVSCVSVPGYSVHCLLSASTFSAVFASTPNKC